MVLARPFHALILFGKNDCPCGSTYVVTYVAKLLSMIFPGTHISLFQTRMWYRNQIVDNFVKEKEMTVFASF